MGPPSLAEASLTSIQSESRLVPNFLDLASSRDKCQDVVKDANPHVSALSRR